MFGLFLIVLGTFLLMEKLGLIQGDFWGYFWPLLIIVIGLNMMTKDKKQQNCFSFWCGDHDHHKKNKHGKVVDN